jgi:hypothetical protein
MSENSMAENSLSNPRIPIQVKSPMELEHIEHSSFLLYIYPQNDLAELTFKAGSVLDEVVAYEIKDLLEKARPERKYNLLVSSKGFFKITRNARILAAKKSFSSHLKAVACYTTNASLILLGELYNKINKPTVVTKIFPDREMALEWLVENINSQDSDKN